MNIEHLQYFITVAQLENISKAASILHLSQSSLSKIIKKVEDDMETPLFDRVGKRLILNESGERLLNSAEKILKEMDEVNGDLKQLKKEIPERKVKIGLMGCENKIISAMSSYKKGHPDVVFDIESHLEFSDYVDINEYDVLVYRDEVRFNKFNGFQFGTEKIYLAVGSESRYKNISVANLASLDNLDYIFIKDSEYYDLSYYISKALAINMRQKNYADSKEMQRQMIVAGMGCGFVYEGTLPFYSCPEIKILPILDKRFSLKMKICFKREKHLTDQAEDFKNYLIKKYKIS